MRHSRDIINKAYFIDVGRPGCIDYTLSLYPKSSFLTINQDTTNTTARQDRPDEPPSRRKKHHTTANDARNTQHPTSPASSRLNKHTWRSIQQHRRMKSLETLYSPRITQSQVQKAVGNNKNQRTVKDSASRTVALIETVYIVCKEKEKED